MGYNEELANLDLKRWRTVSVKLLKRGKSLNFMFVSDHIPNNQQNVIKSILPLCGTIDDVKSVFAGVGSSFDLDDDTDDENKSFPNHRGRPGMRGGSLPKGGGAGGSEEDDLRDKMTTSKYTSSTGNYSKGTFESRKVDIEGDGSAIVKLPDEKASKDFKFSDNGELVRNEIDAYHLSQDLGFDGIVPMTVGRKYSEGGKEVDSSFQHWVDDALTLNQDRSVEFKSQEGLSFGNQIGDMIIFDVVSQNPDRHLNNILVEHTGENGKIKTVHAIDNGLAFVNNRIKSERNNIVMTFIDDQVGDFAIFKKDRVEKIDGWIEDCKNNGNFSKSLSKKYKIDTSNLLTRLTRLRSSIVPHTPTRFFNTAYKDHYMIDMMKLITDSNKLSDEVDAAEGNKSVDVSPSGSVQINISQRLDAIPDDEVYRLLFEKEIKQTMMDYFRGDTTGQKTRVKLLILDTLTGIESKGIEDIFSKIFNAKFWKDEVNSLFARLNLQVLMAAFRSVSTALAGANLADGESLDFDANQVIRINDVVKRWTDTYTYDLVSGITETTKIMLQRKISAWVGTGLNVESLSQELEGVFGESRALAIAQSETTRAFSQGQVSVWNETGVKYAEWITREDEKVCPICGSVNNQITGIAKDISFLIEGNDYLPPPAHTRCRCYMRGHKEYPTKSYPNTGKGKHRGIPGVRGGSLPRNAPSVGTENETEETLPEGYDNTPLGRALYATDKQIVRKPVEELYIHDINGNLVFKKIGEEHKVGVNDSELFDMKDKVLTHNHPSGSRYDEDGYVGWGFSVDDLRLVVDGDLAEIRAVTVARVYSLKRPEGGWGINGAKAFETIKQVQSNVYESFNMLIKKKELTVGEAQLRHGDEMSKRLAAIFKWKYKVTDRYIPKPLGIVQTKSYPNNGKSKHRGIPGHQGGSLPRAGGDETGSSGSESSDDLPKGYNNTPLGRALYETDRAISWKENEELYVHDDGGNIILKKRGDDSSVGVNDNEAVLLEDKISTHNHPCANDENIGQGFSAADIDFAIRTNVKETRVTTPLHTYSLKRPEGGWNIEPPSERYIKYMHEKIANGVRVDFTNAIESKKMTHSEALDNHFREITRRLSDIYGWIYTEDDRVLVKPNNKKSYPNNGKGKHRGIPGVRGGSLPRQGSGAGATEEEGDGTHSAEFVKSFNQKANEFASLPFERMAIFDDNGKVIMESGGDATSCGGDYIDRNQNRHLHEGKIGMHNHPLQIRDGENMQLSFSPADIEYACEFRVKEEIVVTRDYVFSMKQPEQEWAGWNPTYFRISIQPLIYKYTESLKPVLAKRVDNHELTNAQADELYLHEIWTNTCRDLGIEYTRTPRKHVDSQYSTPDYIQNMVKKNVMERSDVEVPKVRNYFNNWRVSQETFIEKTKEPNLGVWGNDSRVTDFHKFVPDKKPFFRLSDPEKDVYIKYYTYVDVLKRMKLIT